MSIVDRLFRGLKRRSVGSTALLTIVLLLALPASAAAAPFRAVLHAPNHTPRVNKKWWITVDVTRGHAKLSGSVKYEFLLDGQLVGHEPGHRFTGGVYRDSLVFPAQGVNIKLTLETIVTTKYGTVKLPWTVTAKR